MRLETPQGEARTTLSLGIAEMLPPPDDTMEKVIRRADEAMYAAKQAGRNRVAVYSAPAGSGAAAL